MRWTPLFAFLVLLLAVAGVMPVFSAAAQGKKAVAAGDQECSPVDSWGELRVFARGADGLLAYRSHDKEKKSWSKWQAVGDVEVSSAPCAVMSGMNRLHVFFRGADGKMSCYFQDKGQPWSERCDHWAGRELGSAPSAVVVGGVLTVFARSKDAKLMQTYWDGEKGSWTEWEDLD